MIVTLCLIILAALPLIGFLRQAIDGNKPDYLLNARIIIKSWHTGNTWLSRFAPIFSLLIFLFNLSAWGIYGFTSIFTFIAFVFSKIWWLIQWIWYEVLHPTIFTLAKLLWHYIIVFSFKFFKNAIVKIGEACQWHNIKFTFKRLLIFAGLSAILGLAYLLTQNLIVLVVCSFIGFYLFQYTVFTTVSYYRSASFPKAKVFPGIKISILWLAIAALSTAILVALSSFSDLYIISGLGVVLSQILIPVAIIFAFAFMATTLYLPAYMAEKGEEDIEVFAFLKAIIWRSPKLIFSQIFQQLGIGVLSIIPVLIIVLLNFGIQEITTKDLSEWGSEVTNMDYHIPAVTKNYKNKALLQTETAIVNQQYDSIDNSFTQEITDARKELNQANSLKDQIQDGKIHSFHRSAFVGERQSFSMPPLPAYKDYVWSIINLANNREIQSSTMQATAENSLLFYYRWTTPGKYRVILKNSPYKEGELLETMEVEVLAMDSMALEAAQASKYFASRELADYAINLLNEEITSIQNDKEEALKSVEADRNILLDQLAHIQFDTQENIMMLIAKILAFIGLLLLAVMYLSAIWTYFTTYHFDMFSFEQEGKHYWVKTLDALRERNPNQPLLGIFVLIVIIDIVNLLIAYGLPF